MRPALLLAAALLAATPVFAQGFADALRGRNPIIYNANENEVGVIQRPARIEGVESAVVLPTQKYLDLGYYDIAIPAWALKPRPAGGWYTSLSNQQLASLPALGHNGHMPFWWSSGAN